MCARWLIGLIALLYCMYHRRTDLLARLESLLTPKSAGGTLYSIHVRDTPPHIHADQRRTHGRYAARCYICYNYLSATLRLILILIIIIIVARVYYYLDYMWTQRGVRVVGRCVVWGTYIFGVGLKNYIIEQGDILRWCCFRVYDWGIIFEKHLLFTIENI